MFYPRALFLEPRVPLFVSFCLRAERGGRPAGPTTDNSCHQRHLLQCHQQRHPQQCHQQRHPLQCHHLPMANSCRWTWKVCEDTFKVVIFDAGWRRFKLTVQQFIEDSSFKWNNNSDNSESHHSVCANCANHTVYLYLLPTLHNKKAYIHFQCLVHERWFCTESVLHIIRPRSLWDIDKNPYPEASHFIMSEWGRQPVRPVRLCTIAQCVHCTIL